MGSPRERVRMEWKIGQYVKYQGRICIVSYVDEYGIFLEDVDNDESLCVTLDDAAKSIVAY